MTRYEQTQIGHVIVWSLLAIILIASGGSYGWLYNVSGFDAVAMTLRDGRTFALGTDDPHGLVDAIRRYTSTHFTRG